MVEVTAQQKTSKLPLVISFCVIAVLVACYFLFPSFKADVNEGFDVLTSGEQDRIRDWVSQFGAWGPIVIVIALVVQMFMFVVPNILLIIISILSYGPVWGALLAWFGIFLASSVGYFIGNKLSPVVVHKLVSTKTERKLKAFIRNYGMKAIIVLRLSTFSNDALSLVAGLLNMRYGRYITATMAGITPTITVFAIFGRNGRIEKSILWVGVILVIGLAIYIMIDMKRKKKKSSTGNRLP